MLNGLCNFKYHGGYATVSGTAVTFHYYTQDYLGNNRAVINGTTGAIDQTTDSVKLCQFCALEQCSAPNT